MPKASICLWPDPMSCCGCTDHGEDNTEHRMTGKNTMYEAAARVPMILTGPGVTPNTVIPALASLYDVCTCNDSPWPSFSVRSLKAAAA